MKKKLLFALFLMLGFSLTSFVTFDEEFNVDEEMYCTIVQTHTTCGGWYESQWCDDGLHGTRREWHNQINKWDCGVGFE